MTVNNADKHYLELAQHILDKGTRKDDRTGTGTVSSFGHQLRFDLAKGFPLLTTKRVPFRVVAEELLWFVSGSTDVGELIRKDVGIWNADAYRDYLEEMAEDRAENPQTYGEFIADIRESEYGYDLGPIYGSQWRSWTTHESEEGVYEENGFDYADFDVVDQLAEVIESIRKNPDSRRHIVSAWNVGELDGMVLPPCHIMFQFYVADGKLSCHMYQRSADVFLGLPFNIASYALLTHMVAQVTGLDVGDLVISIGDAHIYRNHVDQVREQMARKSRALPTIRLDESITDIDDFTIDSFEVIGYDPHPTIKAPLSVGIRKETRKDDE